MLDFIEVDDAGIPRLAFSKLTPDRAAALAEVRFDRVVDGKGEDAVAVERIKIKMHDKRAALVSLGQHLGIFVARHKHERKDGGRIVIHITADEALFWAYDHHRDLRTRLPAARRQALLGMAEKLPKDGEEAPMFPAGQ
jgi:hypothetical protein